MLDFFRHLSLTEQILADIGFPVLLGLLAFGRRSPRSTPLNEESDDYLNRAERRGYYLIGLGYICMISLTIYCHVSK
jgi:hypothetical protein